jgi:hypothetical protein
LELDGGLELMTQAPREALPDNNSSSVDDEPSNDNDATAAATNDNADLDADWDDIEGVLNTFV